MVLPSSARAAPPRVAVVVDTVAETAELYESAVVSSLGDVREALRSVGFEPVVVEFDGEPSSWLDALQDGSFDLVFNLCEGLSGQGSEEPLAAGGGRAPRPAPDRRPRLHPGALPPQGPGQRASARAGASPSPTGRWPRRGSRSPGGPFPAIVKPAAEDASLGIDDRLRAHDAAELDGRPGARPPDLGSPARPALRRGTRVQSGRRGRARAAALRDHCGPCRTAIPHIVTYAAKWETSSVDYRGTTPACSGPTKGGSLRGLHRLRHAGLGRRRGRGYGRIDVRMDDRGRLYVIDVNPNPDLSPDAGPRPPGRRRRLELPGAGRAHRGARLHDPGRAGPRTRRPPASAAPGGRRVTRQSRRTGCPRKP